MEMTGGAIDRSTIENVKPAAGTYRIHIWF